MAEKTYLKSTDKVSALKTQGNDAYNSGDWKNAVKYYTEAINMDPENHILYSNRCTAFARMKEYLRALADSEKTIQLKGDWWKGYSRKGAVLACLGRYPEALEAYEKGLKLDPTNLKMRENFVDLKTKIVAHDEAELKVVQLQGEGSSPTLALIKALRRNLGNNIILISKLLEMGANVNYRTDEDQTPLMSASSHGNREAVIAFIKAGADVNASDENGSTALHFAAFGGYSAIVEILINAGADVNHCDRARRSALHIAALEGFRETMDVLESLGAYSDLQNKNGLIPQRMIRSRLDLDLRDAVIKGDVEKVSKLLRAGANPNFVDHVENDFNLLFTALENKKYEVVPLLLQAGADVNHPDDIGRTPLIYGLETSPDDICQQLLSRNPKIHLKTPRGGTTVLENVLLHCSDEVVELVMSMNPEVNVRDINSATPLMHASRRGRTKWVQILLSIGSRPNDLDKDLKSALHYAAINGHVQTAQILITTGTNPSTRDKEELTAEDYAHANGHYQTAWWLNKHTLSAYRQLNSRPELALCKSKYIDDCKLHLRMTDVEPLHSVKMQHTLYVSTVNAQNEYGRTVLHEAIAKGQIDLVKSLLKFGSLATAVSYDHETPLEVAQKNFNTDIMNLLLLHIQNLKKVAEMSKKEEMIEERIDTRTYFCDHLLDCRMYLDLLTHITQSGQVLGGTENGYQDEETCLSAIQKTSDLLSAGAPLVPPGNVNAYPLHSAITSNCTILLPTLLAAGAPLVSSVCGLGIVQLAWRTPDITTRVGAIVTKAMEDRLAAEICYEPKDDLDRELKRGVENIIKQLQGETPWLAKFPEKLGTVKMTQLLIRACRQGATTIAWWLRQAGGSTIFIDNTFRVTALHAALYYKHYHTATDLIQHMGANPFLADASAQMPITLFPEEHRKEVINVCLIKEASKLDRMLEQTIHGHITQQQEVIRLTHLFATLYICVEMKEIILKEELAAFYAYSLECDGTPLSLQKESESILPDKGDRFWKLLAHIKILYQDFQSMKTRECLYKEKNRVLLEFVLVNALKLCCERRFPLFLHLLLNIGEVDVNTVVNPICMSSPLHHAAAKGNLSAVSYLLCYKADIFARDKFHRAPLHYAYLFGHKLTGEYIEFRLVDMSGATLKCSLGRTPAEYLEAFNNYVKTSGTEEDSSALEHNDPVFLTQHHLKKLKKVWKTEGITNSVKKANVNFQYGEAAKVERAVVNSVKKLLSTVATLNPIFKGELKQLGSSADGVRLFSPDEYDFNWILENMTGLPEGGLKVELVNFTKDKALEKGYDRYVQVTACREDFTNWCRGSVLLPEFLTLIKKCLIGFSFDDPCLTIVPPGVKYKMVGVGLTLQWSGDHYPLLLIDVDIVPTVQAFWFSDLEHSSLLPQSADKLYVSTSLTDEWRLSSGILENLILKNLTDRQKEVFLACKMLISTLKVDDWLPDEIKKQYRYFDNQLFRIPVPNGFILKNCFFKELEEVKIESDWHENKIVERMISIFRRMCHPFHNELSLPGSKYVPGQVYAYFGGAVIKTMPSGKQVVSGATDKPYIGYGAPDILQFLESF